MDNFKTIYRILKALEKHMDEEEIPKDLISYKKLKISEERWERLMKMLVNKGYIEGIKILYCDDKINITVANPEITLKGLEYLEENSLMKKAANIAKGIIDAVS